MDEGKVHCAMYLKKLRVFRRLCQKHMSSLSANATTTFTTAVHKKKEASSMVMYEMSELRLECLHVGVGNIMYCNVMEIRYGLR